MSIYITEKEKTIRQERRFLRLLSVVFWQKKKAEKFNQLCCVSTIISEKQVETWDVMGCYICELDLKKKKKIQQTLCNIPEERMPQLNRYCSLQPGNVKVD